MAATFADTRSARLPASPLTNRGLVVALTCRLRQAVETLPPAESVALLAELRELAAHYAPPRPQPAA